MLKLLLVTLFVVVLIGVVSGQVGDCPGMNCTCEGITHLCCLQVEENVSIGTLIGSASISPSLREAASMPNAIYGIESLQFQIEATSGNISTMGAINREVAECYSVIIQVNGPQSFETLLFAIEVTDINDNAPEFTGGPGPIQITIPETTSVRPTIDCVAQEAQLNALRATDEDAGQNGAVSYSIQGSSVLSIPDPNTALCIQNSAPLDRDDPSYQPYEFILIATDNGNPPNSANITVILSLEGVDEFPLMFPPGNSFSFPESATPGSVVHRFLATDNDRFDSPQQIRYAIAEMPPFFPFTLNGTSGELTLNQPINADGNNELPEFVFQIQADDLERSTVVEVTLTVTDVNEPAIFTVSRQEPIVEETNSSNIDVIVLFEVQDDDFDESNKNNSLEIISGADIFEVVSFVDNFYLRQIGKVDREKGTPIPITVRLIERGVPMYTNQTITVYINVTDVNDNYPQLNITSIDYVENDDTGYIPIVLLRKYVSDLDAGENGEVKSITLLSAITSEEDDITDSFISHQDSNNRDLGAEGKLNAPPIDREEYGDVITINVNITDNGMGNTSLSSIGVFTLRILDINDNPPRFERKEYSFTITEEQAQGTNVGRVTASDPDKDQNGIVEYKLASGSDYFNIDAQSGMITTKVVLDRENVSRYIISVTAVDQGNSSKSSEFNATVFINVTDINDNRPEFSADAQHIFNMRTDNPVNSVIGVVMAVDPDEGENARITYELDPFVMNFKINQNGQIILRQAITTVTSFNLTVIASDPADNIAKHNIIINVNNPPHSEMETIIFACVGGAALIILGLLIILLFCCCCYRRRKGQYKLKDTKNHQLNNFPERVNSITKPILKSVPATNGSIGSRERTQVSFSTRVDETHYKPEGAVTDNSKVLRKASITNFGSSDESPQVPVRDSPIHNGGLPSMQVIEYENSPGQHINGITNDIPGMHPRYEMHHISHNSPIHIRRDMTDNADQFSQTSSTTDVNDSEEEESMFSDGASNMNTSIPCFPKDDQDLHRYGAPPPPHPPLYPHIHSSHIPSPNLLGIIHPGNMSSLAAPEGSYQSSQGNGYTTRHSQDHSNSDTSSQTTTPSPHPRHQMMGPPAIRPIHSHSNGHDYSSRKLVMPDAYPTALVPDMRHVHDHYASSYSDYGEASTYASIELDEALNCNYEPEPGFYSLTATDYDDQEDT